MSFLSIRLVASMVTVLALAGAAHAQTPAPALTFTLPGTLPSPVTDAALRAGAGAQPVPVTNTAGEWKFTVYPILAWVPTNIGIDVTLPFDIGGGSGGSDGSGGSGGSNRPGGSIVDPRFDGALLAGFAATNGTWRFDFDGVYAAIGGDRVTPNLSVDVDVIYGHATISRVIAGDFYVTGGVRRLALKFDVALAGFDLFSRKPGIWDPLVGVAYHKVGDKLELHAHAEYGGFGVGADSDFGTGVRVDWKPWQHFGFTAGYNFIRFKFTEEIGPFEFSATQHVGGPVVGIGLYF